MAKKIRQGTVFWQREHSAHREHPRYSSHNPDLVIARKWLSQGVTAKEKILDIGAGAGKITSGLQNTRQSVVSLDPTNITTHHHKIPQTSVRGISQNLPFKNNSFNRVLMAYSLTYAPSIKKALREAKRVVKQNGVLVVLLHKPKSIYMYELEGHMMDLRNLAYKLREWQELGLWNRPYPIEGIAFRAKTKKEFEAKVKSIEEQVNYLDRMLERQERIFSDEAKTTKYFESQGFEVQTITTPRPTVNNKQHYTGYALLLKNK